MAIPKIEECKPGIIPTGFNVLVAIEPVQEKIGSVFIPDSARDKEKLIAVRGRIVAMSPAAFDFTNWPENSQPKIGDAVLIAKLSGVMMTGADNRDYRLVEDKSINAIVDEEAFA